MYYIIAGFLFGTIIPYLARRFAKFMPATPAYALYRMVKPNKKAAKSKNNLQYRRLLKKYRWRSLMYGVITAALSALVWAVFADAYTWWYLAFVWVLLLSAEIDLRILVLPDILTVPLLIAGFAFAAFAGGFISAPESAAGAVAGYVLPVAATLLMLWYSSEAFGGGDIKLLAAIGAWLGAERLIWTILLSCVIFGVCSALRRRRAGAFGPALAAAAIAILLFLA